MKTFLIVLIVWCSVLEAQTGVTNRVYVRIKPEFKSHEVAKVLQVPAGVIIEQPLLRWEQSEASKLLSPTTQNSTTDARLKTEEPLLRTYTLQLPDNLSPTEFCTQLVKSNMAVEVAIPIYTNQLQFTPNDVRFAEQQFMKSIHAEEAWDVTRGDSTVLIGISDAGMRTTHEDLVNSIAYNTKEIPNNNIDDDNNGYVDDYKGYNISFIADKTSEDSVFHPQENHGTKASGLVAATSNNGKGISGVAGKCRLVPIKTVPNNLRDVIYGYESLLYAVARGCKVVNCSWGNERQTYNVVEQSIVDYAISKDVALVVSAGNYGGINPCFPASYSGVLSVGETNPDGFLVGSSNYGSQCLITAPGEGALTTDHFSDDAYSGFAGTSSASPIVAGVVGLVRSKFPTLTAMQALEQVRVSADDISSKNVNYQKLIPGFVNAKSAVTRKPFSTPAVRVLSYTMQKNSLNVARAHVGDTVQLFLKAKNYLGKGTDMRFALSVGYSDISNVLEIIDSVVTIPAIQANEDFVVAPFKVLVQSASTKRMILRVDITGKGDPNENEGTTAQYRDFAKVDFFATKDFATLSNDSISFSVGDYGWLGTNAGAFNGIKGNGFNVKGIGNLLYRAGLMVVHEPTQKARCGFGSDGDSFNDFDMVKVNDSQPFMLTLTDTSKTTEKIGVEVEQQFVIPNNSSTVAKVILNLKNMNNTTLKNVAMGYFFDWDITLTGDSSKAEFLPEAVVAAGSMQSVAEIATRSNTDPVVGAAAISGGLDVLGQAAGLNAEFTNGFDNAKKIQTLNSGIGLQQGNGDVSMVVGMKYSGDIQPNQSRECIVCFGAAKTRKELAAKLYDCQLGTDVSVHESSPDTTAMLLQVTPQPANDNISVQLQANADATGILSLVTLNGEIILQRTVYCTDGTTFLRLPTTEVAQGVYVLHVRVGNTTVSKLITIVK